MKLSTCMHQFFDQYLPHIKGVSENTIKAYRDTFTLFFPFAADCLSIKIDSLMLSHLSPNLILAFLEYLETQRNNIPTTRNLRLATFKSLAKMIRLFYPEEKKVAERLLNLPQKRAQKPLIAFLSHEEVLKVIDSVNIKNKDAFRDYAILNLLYDSGARASEIASLNLDYFNLADKTIIILGKGNRYRQIQLYTKTAQLINLYITQYRITPKPGYQNRLFINQRGDGFTRHGIYRICQKYLSRALPAKRLKKLHPVHTFRHSCAVRMLYLGKSITEIKNRLGHENIQTTMGYLKLDISRKREIQKKIIEYTQSIIKTDSKIEELIDWENKEETLAWLDSL